MTDLFADRSVTVTEDGAPVVFRYRLLEPPPGPPEKGGRKLPVVLFLHGAGERGSDNERQLAYLPTWLAEPAARERHPCFVIAPQCRTDHRWVEVAWNDRASSPQAATLTGSPISSRRRESTGIATTGCLRPITGCEKPSRHSRSAASASNARPRPVGMGTTVAPREAAATRIRIKSPARTTPPDAKGQAHGAGGG